MSASRLRKKLRLESFYLSPIGRELFAAGPAEFVPVSYYREGTLPPGLDNFNVYLLTVSPPDESGCPHSRKNQVSLCFDL